MGLALAGIGAVWGAVAALPRVARLSPRPAAEPPPPQTVQVDPRLKDRLLEKIRYLSMDLRVDPRHRLLLTEATRGYLSLAVWGREMAPDSVPRWLEQAGKHAARLRHVAPEDAALLELDIRDVDQLTWAAADPSILPVLTPTGLPKDSPNRPMLYPPQRLMPEVSPPGPDVGPPRSDVPFRSPGLRVDASLRPARRGGGMNGPSGPAQPPPDLDAQTAALRAQLAREPSDVRAADQLGGLLERHAAQAWRREPNKTRDEAARPYLLAARELYHEAFERARLRIYRAAFRRAEADVWALLHNSEQEYACLSDAVKWTPFAPSLWRNLSAAALRTDRMKESRAARQKVQEWTLPVLRRP